VPKNAGKTKKLLEEIEIEDTSEDDAELEKIVTLPAEAKAHVKLNFPPFWHYRLDENDEPFLVGKSHWIGGMENGHFSREHGAMTKKLAHMFMKLCERYATRSNWRGYTYNDEMRSQALLQLSQIGLQFDESKSQNPFAYYTATITNSFTRILNIEKKNQNQLCFFGLISTKIMSVRNAFLLLTFKPRISINSPIWQIPLYRDKLV
jgi:hypothetical protein